ncbi:MAG: hypothetical protein KAX38_09590, partial [Candidatus Krumholzibacteria bacterium]|nr:hypothetical protein [Candidatus Krumholzibacteria bacterium]
DSRNRKILTCIVVPPINRCLILSHDSCLALNPDGDVEWSSKLQIPFEGRVFCSQRGREVKARRLSGRPLEIWCSYTLPVKYMETEGRILLACGCGDSIVVFDVSEDSSQQLYSVDCGGHVLDICMGDSSFCATGGGHTGLHWKGFLHEYSYSGRSLKKISLSYPGVFIDKIKNGLIVQAFQNQLLYFSDRLRLLAVDHSPLYPTFLTHLYLDEDEAEDIVVGGLSEEIGFQKEQVDGIIRAIGRQQFFSNLSLQGDRYKGFTFRVDCYLNRIEDIRERSLRSLDEARLLALERGREAEAEIFTMEAREGFFRIDDIEGVNKCDSEIEVLGQLVFDRQWFMPLLFVGCIIGGLTGVIFTRRIMFSVAALVFIAYSFVLFQVFSFKTAQSVVLISALCLFVVAFIRLRQKRHVESFVAPGPSEDRYRSFLMTLGAFGHSGRATHILESLNLLLLSYPKSKDEIPEYLERFAKRSDHFLEIVIPQIKEIGDLLQTIVPRGALGFQLDDTALKLERGLASVSNLSHVDKELLDGILNDIDCMDEYMRKLRRFVKAYPGAPALKAVEDIYELKREQLLERRIDVEIVPRLKYSTIVYTGKHEIEAIIENLFSNSQIALENVQQRSILVELYEKDKFVVIEFSDSGPGIDPERLGGLFKSKDDIDKGGFGLPYTWYVLNKVGGSIRLGKSRLGGATFVLRFVPWHLVMRSFLLQGPEKAKVGVLEKAR